jgi:Major tropism determinant N-terminal domain
MSQRIQIKRGLKANLPSTGMLAGEPHVTTDRGTLHVSTDATTKLPVVPAIDDLVTLSSIAGSTDLLIVHDASETSGQKEKKITFDSFKSALNIPAGSTDEKVAVVAGGAAGYIYGTDGTDGVIRLNTTLSWVKDAGNGFVTIAVNSIDGGTF